jgi:hypothetical protein
LAEQGAKTVADDGTLQITHRFKRIFLKSNWLRIFKPVLLMSFVDPILVFMKTKDKN